MNIEARISGIRDLLINGDLSEAIATTSELVDEIGKDSFNYSIYLIHEQYNQLIRDNVEGSLSRENLLLERNKITLSILQLLQVIQYQKSEGKSKRFFYFQAAVGVLSLLLFLSLAYIFFNRNNIGSQQNIAQVEPQETPKATIVNNYPEEILQIEDSTAQEVSNLSNNTYFDSVPEEVNYQQSIFDLSEDEFGITLRFIDSRNNIDELIEAPIKISVSKLKNKLISYFDLEESSSSSGEWQLFANDKKVTRESRNLERAGLFDYDLITVEYVSEGEEEIEVQASIGGREEDLDDSFFTEQEQIADNTRIPTYEEENQVTNKIERRPSTQLVEPVTEPESPTFFESQETNRTKRPPVRTVDGPPQLPEIETSTSPTTTSNSENKKPEETITTSTSSKEEVIAEEKDEDNRTNKREEKKDRKKEATQNKQTFSYLVFVPGETSIHLRQSTEVFNTKTNNYYKRNSFTEEDLKLLTNRKLLIRDKDGQKLYTTLRSSSNQYFVAVEGGVGASEEDFYTIIINGKKMPAIPISSKEYDRLLKVANASFKGPRVEDVKVSGNGSDFSKKSIVLSQR